MVRDHGASDEIQIVTSAKQFVLAASGVGRGLGRVKVQRNTVVLAFVVMGLCTFNMVALSKNCVPPLPSSWPSSLKSKSIVTVLWNGLLQPPPTRKGRVKEPEF